MNDETSSWGNSDSELSVSARVDMACDDFEEAWKQGRSPAIESYLVHLPEADQPALFRELLQVELGHLTKEEGESPLIDTYLKRFPAMRAEIETLFSKLVPPKRLGDYDLLEMLGKGGMGVVYRARHRRLDKIVAVKVLPESCLEDDGLARFEREMRSTARLDHPNIVQATDARVDNGVYYLVMEHIDGVTFHEIISGREKPVPYQAACEAIRQAALGLEHAWHRKLVHRDIKPSNLMLNSRGDVKILDFGLARVRSDEATRMLTQSGFAMGTVDYMAPEQWEDSSTVDVRADIYSLACTFYFLLTREPPFGGKEYPTARKKFMAHMTAAIPSVIIARPDCPKELDNLIHHMLAKETSDRIPTPTELIDTIGPYCDRGALNELVDAPRQECRTSGVATKGGQWQQTTRPGTMHSGVSNLLGEESGTPADAPPLYSRRMFVATTVGTAGGAALAFGAWRLWPNNWKEPLQASLSTLPVLYGLPDFVGAWWFEELPWLTPGVRQYVVTAIHQGEKRIGEFDLPALGRQILSADVDHVMAELKKLATAVEPELTDEVEQNCTIKLQSLVNHRDDPHEYVKELQSVLQEIGEPSTATQHHLHAVISHQLARKAPENQGYASQAIRSYDLAHQFYEQETPTWLLPLCLADTGFCYYHGLAPPPLDDGSSPQRDAETTFTRALNKSSAPAFQVSIGCQLAEVLKKKRAYDQAMQHLDKADEVEQLPVEHPLKALVHDRRGYVLRDAWFFTDAVKSFESAIRIRRSAKEGIASICKLVSRQGLATVRHCQGRIDQAREDFDDLISEVEHSNVGIIRDRGPNVYERRAVCELVGACSNRKTQAAAAADFFALGRDMAESRHFNKDHRRRQVFVLHAWQRIAQLLAAQEDNDTSNNRETIETTATEQGLTDGEQADFKPHLQLADAIVAARSAGATANDRADPIVQFVADSRSKKNVLRPRDIELHLIAVEQALSIDLNEEQLLLVTRELHDVMDKAGKIIDARPPEGREFFYPYAQLALASLEAAAEESPLTTGLTRQHNHFMHWLNES